MSTIRLFRKEKNTLMNKILYIDPAYDDSYINLFNNHLNKYAEANITVEVESLGGQQGPEHVEYSCYEVMVMPDIVRKVIEAEKKGFNAVIIGCFYDPALQAAREVSKNMMISAPAESAFSMARSLGSNMSIIVGRTKTIPQIKQNVYRYGMAENFAGFRSVDLGVLEFQKDSKESMKRIRAESRKAIQEDNADVIVLGCTAELGFHESLQKELGVPVLDASIAALKYVEMLVNINNKAGWSHSRVNAYESPPHDEAVQFGLYNK